MIIWAGIPPLILAVAAWLMLERSRPLTCPHCQRFNVLSRRKTGLSYSDIDPHGSLIQYSEETVCKRCGEPYWITRDDFNGRSATKELQRR